MGFSLTGRQGIIGGRLEFCRENREQLMGLRQWSRFGENSSDYRYNLKRAITFTHY
jgi:hypothetical protein